MATVGGRNAWIAWLAAPVLVAVVGTLVWLARPMAPIAVEWAGQVLRGELQPVLGAEPPPRPAEPPEPAPPPPSPSPSPAGVPETCEELYPAALWERLHDAEDLVLDESVPSAPSAVPSLPAALSAETLVGCAWTDSVGRAVTTLARVPEAAPAEAARLLAEAGFSCADDEGGVRCERVASEGVDAETHIVREGLWLASIRSYPGPPFELSGTAARVWPA